MSRRERRERREVRGKKKEEMGEREVIGQGGERRRER